MLMESGRVATMFRVLTGSVATALDVFPFSSVEVSVEAKEQVELVMKQGRKARFEVEVDDERAMMCVVSIFKQFERNVVPSEGDLRWVLDYIGVRGWSECNKEVEFLGGEIGFEQFNEERGKVGFLCSLMGFMSYCRCVVMMEVVDGEEIKSKPDDARSGRVLSCFKFDDFRCPISLELMTDPVTIETGHTYDRSSILRWFRSGNQLCPKTGKRLSSIELVPNLAIRRLVHQYCCENGIPVVADQARRNRSVTRTAQPGSLATEGAMRMVASFLSERLENGEKGEKNRAAYEIRILFKTSIFNRTCLVESGSIPLLLKLLTWRDASAQENAIAALLNLSKHPKGRALMVENWGIGLIVGVLSKGLKIEARHHAAATLFYLASSKEEYGKMIGEEPEAIPSLVRLIKDGSERGKKNGLVAMFGLLIHPENHRRVLASGPVPLLVNILRTCENEDLVTDSLAVLATLAEKSDGTTAMLHCGALHVAVETLRSSTSRVGKEHCVSLLLSLSINGGVDVVAHLAKSPSIMGSLYSQLSEGTSRASKKASTLIRTLHDFCERRSSDFKTSVLPQEQFIHLW